MPTDTTDEPAAEWTARSSIQGWPKNPRKNDATVPVVADSIRRFGFGAPIVSRRANREIIAGHTRALACDLLTSRWAAATTRERSQWHPDAVRVATKGEVVVRFVDLDEHDAHLLAIADNRIGETLSEDDDERLREVLDELASAEVDLLDGTGLSDDSVRKLLGADPAPDAGATGTDPGDGRYKEQFGVIVICADESEQQRAYEQLKADGFNCRVVVT